MRAQVAVGALAMVACTPIRDPSLITDLRVIGVKVEPPEILLPGCTKEVAAALIADAGSPATLNLLLGSGLAQAALQNVELSAFIADFGGEGRLLNYTLRVCANQGDIACADAGSAAVLAQGVTPGGVLTLSVLPAAKLTPDGNSILLQALLEDTYRGLGGVRLPLSLELTAPNDGGHIYAQKLMVYSCKLFDNQRANVNPVLPGLLLDGHPWSVDGGTVTRGDVTVGPMDFRDLQETYLVADFNLQPISLTENWQLTYLNSFTAFDRYQVGGGQAHGDPAQLTSVMKLNGLPSAPVYVMVVVRDGRGGENWLVRTLTVVK